MRSASSPRRGVNGLSTLLVESEQFTPASRSLWTAVTPRMTLWSCAGHQEQVGGGQHGEGDAGIGQAFRGGAKRAGSAAESW